MDHMSFVTIPAATYELGWRFSGSLPSGALDDVSSLISLDDLTARFSTHRKVALAAFEVAARSITLQSVLGDPHELEDVATIEGLCALIDARLACDNWRLPTEDELEAAAGGALFAWGMKLPDGIPYGAKTSFVGHKKPNSFGLTLNSDPYQVEICRHALKFGDGGSSICGDDPWPLAWLSLSPSFRLGDDDIAECFLETLETAHIRPVKRG
jgi:hypothetical protein